MAISKQLRDEADRTIAGITSYYEQYGDALVDAEEREHRISKVVASLEGCNGITDKEKLQKTAENLFGLTCAWERDSLALKRELMLNREATEKAFKKTHEDNAREFTRIGASIEVLEKKIDGMCTSLSKISSSYNQHISASEGHVVSEPTWYHKAFYVLDKHFGTAVIFALVFFILIILSGNLDWVTSLRSGK